MKTNKDKRTYTTPTIECVNLDNEISLILQSVPPKGPGEITKAPEHFNNDPFKSDIG
jgi:hypothetical protein